MKIEKKSTNRGFALNNFKDINGSKCNIQKSSLAFVDAIWFGVDNAKPQILARDAKQAGIETNETTGWVAYPIPSNVLLTTRMHLNRRQVLRLLPILIKFVITGRVS